MDNRQDSNVVKSIKIEVVNKDKPNIALSTNFSDDVTIRILKECLILLEREVSQKSSTD